MRARIHRARFREIRRPAKRSMKKLRPGTPAFWFWILYFLPAGVVWIPGFQTHLSEDVLLLAAATALAMRCANPYRPVLPPNVEPVLKTAALFLAHGALYLGFARVCANGPASAAALYPAAMLAALMFRPPAEGDGREAFVQRWFAAAAAFSLVVFALLYIWTRTAVKEWHPEYMESRHWLVPGLLTVPVLALSALLSRRAGCLNRASGHLPFLALMLVPLAAAWPGNLKTFAVWYEAGKTERAWAPFAEDDPEKIAALERKPHEAARLYETVRSRLAEKGPLPEYWNWTFFMKFRMAVQAVRMDDPALCLDFLPPGDCGTPSRVAALKQLWSLEPLRRMAETEPNYPRETRIWMDMEIDPRTGAVFTMDRFGRVYQYEHGEHWPKFDPAEPFADALDLEILGGVWIVARADGRVAASESIPFLEEYAPPAPLPEPVNDFEIHPNGKTAVFVYPNGRYYTVGEDAGIPHWDRLDFGAPVIADFEFDPDGRGYYLLDIHGAIHANHADGEPSLPHKSPPLPPGAAPYWAGMNRALDLEIGAAARAFHIHTRTGEAFPVAATPERPVYRPRSPNPRRGAAMAVGPDGVRWILESNGAVTRLD